MATVIKKKQFLLIWPSVVGAQGNIPHLLQTTACNDYISSIVSIINLLQLSLGIVLNYYIFIVVSVIIYSNLLWLLARILSIWVLVLLP